MCIRLGISIIALVDRYPIHKINKMLTYLQNPLVK